VPSGSVGGSAASPSASSMEPSPPPPKGGPPRGGDGSLWQRNVELCAWTVPLNLLLALVQSAAGSADSPMDVLLNPLRGFEVSTWGIIVVNGIGGLLVAMVIKYADNIWKGFATAGAIVLTGTIAPLLDLGPPPGALMLLGAVIVTGSLMLFAMPSPPAAVKTARAA